MRDEKISADERMGYEVTYPMDFFLIFITTIVCKLLRLWLKLPLLGVSRSCFLYFQFWILSKHRDENCSYKSFLSWRK